MLRCDFSKVLEGKTVRGESMRRNASKANQVPDISYDLDGDGVVGQKDYFISKHFDHDRDERLDTRERAQAMQALKDGWLDSRSSQGSLSVRVCNQ